MCHCMVKKTKFDAGSRSQASYSQLLRSSPLQTKPECPSRTRQRNRAWMVHHFPSFFHPCSAIVIHCHPFVPSTFCNMLSIFYRFLHAIVELDPTGISLFHLLSGLLGTLYHGVLCHEQCRPTQMVGPQTREVQHDQRAASVYSKQHTQVEQHNIVKFCDSS